MHRPEYMHSSVPLSRRNRLPRNVMGVIFLLTLALLANHISCGGSDTTAVNVTLVGATPEVDSVRVNFSLDGAVDQRSPYRFKKNTTFFGIEMHAPNNRGTLSIGVELLGKDCVLLSGQDQVKIDGGVIYEVRIQIVPKTKTCPITVTKYGEGNVTSQPSGISCGASCVGYFDYDKPVTLTATPGIPGTPFIWGGTCGTSSTCVVTPSEATAVGIDFRPKVCRPSQFCWEYPIPLASNLRGVWVSPSLTSYVVGDYGTILRSTPAGWASMDSGSPKNLQAVWGNDDTDIWAVGLSGAALHWKTNAWANILTTTTQPLRAVWGASPSAVWAVGDQGTILRWDGATWAAEASPVKDQLVYLTSIWGTSNKDIWVTGDNGLILHYDGTNWTKSDSQTTNRLRSVWGTGSGDVWAVGDMGTVRRWNGTSWLSPALVNAGMTRLESVWGAGVNTVWASGTETNTQGQSEGVIYAWNGSTWSKLAGLDTAGWANINGKAPSNGWAVGANGSIAQYDGTKWTLTTSQVVKEFRSVWMTAQDDGWAVGAGGQIYRWDSLTWKPQPGVTTVDLKAVWGTSRDDVWAVGNQGTVLHFTGSAWASIATGSTATFLSGIAGNGPNDVWIAGDDIVHWDGSAWNKVTAPPIRLSGIFVQKSTVYGYGSAGIYQYANNAWTQVSAEYISKIAGDGTNLYAAGFKGIYQLSGMTWKLVSPSTAAFSDIYYRSDKDIWSVGEQGTILHWDGTAWTSVDNNVAATLFGVIGFGDRDTWVVGDGGAILHRR